MAAGVVADRSPAVEDLARATMRLARDRFGRLDILVNNAGRTLNKPITETSVDDFEGILRVNAGGDFVQAREAFARRASAPTPSCPA
ncbi:SDR family NAD(P)-dependent oxidoreductase [Actinomadura decatromicini]|uniref:SDR family NAD(P)-dependent oxidoreductase n=1 Tax=Actinomadura decatromicini TaxID=2604572 RepID=UPI001CA30A42|nr:SDR family NAD(P)-dependent oxidoreductase [Actinomadura decatromicini]